MKQVLQYNQQLFCIQDIMLLVFRFNEPLQQLKLATVLNCINRKLTNALSHWHVTLLRDLYTEDVNSAINAFPTILLFTD